MRKVSNADVVNIVNYGGDAENGRGSFWGTGSPSRFTRANRGYIPEKVGQALDTAADNHGGIDAIIYSYATPIAVKIAGVWLVPDVRYSATTSTKHATHLWKLGNVAYLPADASAEDVENIIAGYVVYDRWNGMRRGNVTRPEFREAA